MEIIALITGIVGIIAILLKDYIPGLRKKHDEHKDAEAANDFGKELLKGDDIGASKRLSDEFDKLRSEGNNTSK